MNNQNDGLQQISEDGPVMRSMALVASAASPSTLLRSTVEGKPLYGTSTTVGDAEYERFITEPTASFAKMHLSVVDSTASAAAPLDTLWRVTRLTPIPSYYRLERTHLYLDASVTSAQVTSRIADALRINSIATTFYDNEAKAVGESREGVHFSIRLWSDASREGCPMVVEIQRQSGCSFLYCKIAKAVLRAAKGMPPCRKPIGHTEALPCVAREDETKEEVEQCLTEGLSICTDLLTKSSQRDSHILALESLSSMCMLSKNRSFCAQAIVRGENLSALLSFVTSYRTEASGNLSDMEREHLTMMHRHSLIVLGNCIEALAEGDDLSRNLLAQFNDISILTCLVEQVGNAEKQPHEALAAIQCLQGLLSVSNVAKLHVMKVGAPQALLVAQKKGATSCVILERESAKLYHLLTR